MALKVSRKGSQFVGGWEGFRSCPYRDAVGVWTIGYGTTSAERPVNASTPCISEDTAASWLRSSLNNTYLKAVPRRLRLRQHELDALSSFAYNLGPGALSASTGIGGRLRGSEGKTYKARKVIYREEMPKWVNAGGHPLPGLVARRKAEVELATNGDYSGRP